VLFVAAFPPELAPLDARFVDREIIGVGLVESALGAARVVAERKPIHVVLIGTVGAYPSSGLSIGDVVVAKRVVLAAPSGEMVGAMPASVDADPSIFPMKRVVVATTLAITTDDAVAAAIEGTTAAHVEHLEAFAVARACAHAGVRFSAVFGVANVVGSKGREQWRENHERAAAAACAALLRNPTTMPSPA
jgi:futalosine hydrolase